jgi:NAD(P)-dependent dehydrogenase (short-subunit alcohol dehydrogenase family)
MPPFTPRLTKTFHNSVPENINPTNLSAKGKTVLITGGGRGIGKAIATSFALAGASTIIILGRTSTTLESARKDISLAAKQAGHTPTILDFPVDITDATAVNTVFQTIATSHKSIDVVINNAGALHLGTISSSDITAYTTAFDVNFKGTLHVMHAFVEYGLDRNAASPATFINLSSVGLAMPTFPTWSQYAASKLGAFCLTDFMGVEMEGKVRAFSIHPGMIETDMSRQAGLTQYDDEGMCSLIYIWCEMV